MNKKAVWNNTISKFFIVMMILVMAIGLTTSAFGADAWITGKDIEGMGFESQVDITITDSGGQPETFSEETDAEGSFRYVSDMNELTGEYQIHVSDGSNEKDMTLLANQIQLYSDAGHTQESYLFESGATVYAKIPGINLWASVFVWKDENDNTVRTSNCNSGNGPYYDQYTLTGANPGTWSVERVYYNNDDCTSYRGTETTEFEVYEIVPNPSLAQSCGIDIAVVFDGSGSIDSSEYSDMQDAFVDFVNSFLPNTPTEMAIVEFASTAVLRQGFTSDATTLINEINEARVQPGGQYTNWEQGLVVTQGQFPNRAKPDLVVFASDGNPNRIGDPPSTANAQDATLAAVAVANQLKQDGVRIITLGIGNDVDADNLIAISSADAYYESDFDDLAQDLADIADDLCGGTITVRKLVDGQPAENWEFTAEVCCGGTVTPTTGYTDNNGYAVFDVEVTSTSAYVDITETLMDGYDFVSASCNDGHSIPGDLTVTEIDVYPDSQIYCEFLNTAVECETDDDCAPDNNYCDGDNWVHYSESCINGECLPASSTASCDDGLYCNGDETCEGAGVCTNPADIVCDTPPGPCYEPLGECNEQTDTCVYDYDDTQGPVTSNLAVTPSFNNGIFNVTALATDECTNIEESEFFVGHMGGAHCESPGTGTPMAAFDGNFDELIEDVIAVDANYIVDGLNWACVQSKDVADNWGNCVCTYFETDTIPPICPFDMRIDGSGPNPQEFLICGDEPMVTGHVCDDQSGIQGGEYFIDPTIPPVPPPWSGYWMDINFTYSNPETGMLCTQIMAQLNTTGLQDGTHYIKMRGKDLVENWGKIQFCPSMSFIRDTTPPIVSKELFPAGGVSVGCDIQEMNGHQITAGCEYVKTGTQIELSAHDPDPQGTGEFAGDVIIHYKVWYSYDGSSWTLQQQGQSQPDENVTITLTEDSYHLVEFWATDGCSLSTEHYFELDIVDNQAPEIIKTITGPQLDGEAPIHKYLTSESVISLECSDVEPHPVGGEQLVWAMYWSYNDLNNWQFINSGTDMDGYKEFTDLSDSYHRFVYYCVDALGNTGQDQTEIDAVDNTPPVTTENITGPVYFDGYNTYLDAATRIHLTCNDPEPHPVGGETIYYRYFLDGNMVINWTQYTGEFGFPEESEHELQYYCVDALNNKETTHIETYLVDHTPPITDSSFGTPYYTNGVSEWINFQTPITLTASEPDAPCQSGFKETWYKDVIVDNSYCADPATYCQPVGEDIGTWQLYTEPIYKTEESCHILQYYSVDNVDKTEEMNYRCFYVQNSTPESWKEVGDPKVPYGDPADGNFYVTQNTPISLFCEETGPHPTGNYTIWYAWFLNTPGGDADGDADGDALAFIQWMKYVGPFTYPTDSNHTLLWYCEDALGNREETNYEIDIVDTVPPNTWKVLGTPKKECTPDEKAMYGINDCWYINQNTLVELFCQDPQPHPVDNVEMHYTIEWKENWGDNWQIIGTGTAGDYYNFTYANDSFHRLTWYCEDALGNTGATFEELDIVDTQAPTLTKEVGDPKVIKECPEIGGDGNGLFKVMTPTNPCDYSTQPEQCTYITQNTPINFTCIDEGPHPSNAVTIEYRYRVMEDFDGVWSDWSDWIEYQGEETTFYFPQDSIHELEYRCNDSLGNEDPSQFEIDIVDTQWPEVSKVVGEPKVAASESMYNEVTDMDQYHVRDQAWYITQDTQITLECVDLDPHPVDDVTIYYKYYVDGALEQDWTVYSGPFTYDEDTYHQLYYYCVDALGNTGLVHYELDMVDTQPPETVKTVGTPKVLMNPECDPAQEICDYWVTQATQITLECSDVEPHPVDDVTLRYRINGGEWIVYEGPINFAEDCNHTLEWECVDALGNSEGIQVEHDNVDTAPPEVTKFVIKDGERIYEVENETITIAVQGGETLKFCAEVTDYKQTGDEGVGVDWVHAQFTGLPDPALVWDSTENAYCAEIEMSEHCGRIHYEIQASDLLGNTGEWVDGIEIVIDNVPPIGEVLKPHAGNPYWAGMTFSVYAPAVDFGGDECCGEPEDCPATGVDYCDIYAIDYPFENLNQSEIKECYEDLWTYFEQVFADPYIEYIGRVPYVNGVCKGLVAISENTNLTDTVFMAANWVDKAGNERFGLALNPWFSPITMNMEEKGYLVIDEIFESPVTSEDELVVMAHLDDESYSQDSKICTATVYGYEDEKNEKSGTYEVTHDEFTMLWNGTGYDACILSPELPGYDVLESGLYLYTVRYIINSQVAEEYNFNFMVDNDRPSMTVVSPEQQAVYNEMMPVSLNIGDTGSGIVAETVKFQIKEIRWWGNVWCLGGCEETPWLLLTEQDNGLYAGTFNLSEYGISGDSRYTFDAIACDELYDSSDLDEDGNPVIAGNDRNGHHCKQISVHGAVPEDRVECNDGLDNDWDEDIDYPSDDGCYSGEDDDEGVICGDGYLEGEEECDDGNIVSGDGCSDVCMIEVPEPECGNGVIESEEECDDGEDNGVLCSPDYGSICIYCSETCTNTVFEGGFCGDSIVNGPEQCDNSLCGEGYVCNIYCDCIID